MVLGQGVGGELGGHATPGEAEPGADHRHRGDRAPQEPKRVGEQGEDSEADQRERERERSRAARVAVRRGQCCPEHAHDDGRHGQHLAAAGMLAEHPLSEDHEHEQTGRQCGLHHHERSEQQRRYLQRPPEDGKPRPEQPASAPSELADQAQTQVVLLADLTCVQGLQGDP